MMAKETTRAEYARFRKKWNAARQMADRPPVILDLGDAPPWGDADIDFDEGVDVEFDEPGESEMEETGG